MSFHDFCRIEDAKLKNFSYSFSRFTDALPVDSEPRNDVATFKLVLSFKIY